MQKTLFSFFNKTPKPQASGGNVEKKKTGPEGGRPDDHSGFPAGSLVWSKLDGCSLYSARADC